MSSWRSPSSSFTRRSGGHERRASSGRARDHGTAPEDRRGRPGGHEERCARTPHAPGHGPRSTRGARMNIPALRVCHRFATLPYQEREHDVCVGELAVVMGWSPEHARVEMERMVVQGMLLHKCGDWYTVTDDGARVLKEDE